LSRTRRASRLQGLLLLGRQDLIELGLGLFFEFGELFLLIFRELHLLGDETREQVEPATRSTGTIPVRRASGTSAARTARGTVLRSCLHGNGGNCDDAESRNECWKTSHGDTP
jgi:hypothetical protein